MEEGVDTVGNGVLLLFGGQDFVFGNLGWRRVLTQLVKGVVVVGMTRLLFWKSWLD